MPIITLTQEALDRGKQPDTGWSFAKLTGVNEFKSKDNKSTNFGFEWRCESGPEHRKDNAGRYVTKIINAKALGMGDGRGVPNVIYKFQVMIAALNGIHLNEVKPDNFDTDKLIGKSCYINIQNSIVNDQVQLDITDYASEIDVPF